MMLIVQLCKKLMLTTQQPSTAKLLIELADSADTQ